jgi:glutathione synthase/RimK-type ligase-like ATP-grasp enzyme
MPHTYGIIGPDPLSREKIQSWFHESHADSLIIKPILGHGGAGIVMARKQGNDIHIHSRKSVQPLSDFVMPTEAIVQEVLKQDGRLAVFSSSSVNTIRVVTYLTKNGEVIIASATMRCGVADSFVDNWSAGGVAVGVDCDTGRLKKYAYDRNSKRYEKHPTANIKFENFQIPEWFEIRDIAKRVQEAFPFYCLLGMDVSLLEGGEPVLIEVNANPDLVFQEQTSGPLLKDNRVLKAFGEDDLLTNRYQKNLLKALR